MKSKQIKADLAQLGEDLHNKIKSMSQKEAVRISGLSQPEISYWTNGKRIWKSDFLIEIAGRFGL